MLYPQLVIFESNGLLAALLRPLAEEHKWFMRQPRRLDACLRLLRRGQPAVVVIRVESDVLPALTLLQRVSCLYPDTHTVVVAEVKNAELFGLAWHLGARYVLMPPQPRTRLPIVVENLMEAAIRQLRGLKHSAATETHAEADEDLPEASLEDE